MLYLWTNHTTIQLVNNWFLKYDHEGGVDEDYIIGKKRLVRKGQKEKRGMRGYEFKFFH